MAFFKMYFPGCLVVKLAAACKTGHSVIGQFENLSISDRFLFFFLFDPFRKINCHHELFLPKLPSLIQDKKVKKIKIKKL